MGPYVGDIELIGGGGTPKSETRYFNRNFDSHRDFKVYYNKRLIPDALEADANCNLVRVPDPKGRISWTLGDQLIKTTLSIGSGFVEIIP